jgi:glycosyltransferase involved in cell wall biosynthesis
MTAFNAERFIAEAIHSALDQTSPPDAITVVDDGSTDETSAIAEAVDRRITVLRRDHHGVGASRNAGLATVGTPFVALLDADDVWLPTKLERQLAALADDPRREAAFTWFDEYVDPDDPPPPGTRAPRTAQSAALSSGALLRSPVIERIGAFDEGPVGDWVGWWARARARGIVEHVVPEVLYRRRLHGSNNSFLRHDDGQTFLALAHRHLREVRARRGQTAGGEG